jgi:hypothetical protein
MTTKASSKKSKSKGRIERTSDGMRKEYDMSGGVRGKFAKDFPGDVRLVKLAPDVSEYFPDAKAVNDALRAIIEASKVVKEANRRSVKKAS